ncbi:MAG: usg protein [Parvularculaceae bacterium]|nr:usg protein [Parvularculaceae bacterium]
MRSKSQLALQLQGYRLSTAEILYRLPDHPDLLQTFVWQDYDIAPRYPVLKRFLDFWVSEIEGPLHSVRVAGRRIISAAELKAGTLLHLQ